MKKFWFAIATIVVMLFVSGIAHADTCMSSGLKNSDTAISARPGELCGILIVTDGTNDATAIVYDNASTASGTKLFQGKVVGTANFGGATWEVPIIANSGIYVDITGTGATYIVYFRRY